MIAPVLMPFMLMAEQELNGNHNFQFSIPNSQLDGT